MNGITGIGYVASLAVLAHAFRSEVQQASRTVQLRLRHLMAAKDSHVA